MHANRVSSALCAPIVRPGSRRHQGPIGPIGALSACGALASGAHLARNAFALTTQGRPAATFTRTSSVPANQQEPPSPSLLPFLVLWCNPTTLCCGGRETAWTPVSIASAPLERPRASNNLTLMYLAVHRPSRRASIISGLLLRKRGHQRNGRLRFGGSPSQRQPFRSP